MNDNAKGRPEYLEIIERRKENMKKKYAVALELARLDEEFEKARMEYRKLRDEACMLDDLLYRRMRDELDIPAQPPRIESKIVDDVEGGRT